MRLALSDDEQKPPPNYHFLKRFLGDVRTPWAFAIAAVALAALLVSSGSAMWANAQEPPGGTGPGSTDSALTFLDDDEVPFAVASLPTLGSSARVHIHAEGLTAGEADTFQALITHDPSVIAVTEASCDGLYASASSPGDVSPAPGGEGSRFMCMLPGGVGSSSGAVVSFDIVRVGYGEDEIGLSTEGEFGTAFFTDGERFTPSLPTPVSVLNLPEPSPTATVSPSPSPTATATTPSGGGGGGGGGFVPQPTSTPAPQLFPPGVPTNVQASVFDGTARLTWEPPVSDGGASVTGYMVNLYGTTRVQSLPATARSVFFSGLENGEPVQMRVRAVNAIGPGQYSALTEPLAPAGPPSAPQGVSASEAPSSGSVTVVWAAPLDDNGAAITGYEVVETTGQLPDREVDGVSLSTVFENVTLGTYRFIVRSVNSAGVSEDSEQTAPLTIESASPPVASPTVAEPGAANALTSVFSIDSGLSEQIAAEISQDLGLPVSSTGGEISIIESDGDMVLILPFTSDTPGAFDESTFSVDSLNFMLDFVDGTGTFEIRVSEQIAITGAGQIGEMDGAAVVALGSLRTLYDPPFDAASGSSVHFDVDILDMPGRAEFEVSYFQGIDELLSLVEEEDWDLSTSSGSALSEDPADFWAMADVTVEGTGNSVFGENRVSFPVSSSWVARRTAADREIVIVKVGNSGLTFTRQAECEQSSPSSLVCSASFSEGASGFSTFGLVAFARPPQVEPSPDVNDLTASPSPSAVAGTPVASPSPTPDGGEVTVPGGSTPTPLPEPLPTPALNDGGGGSSDTAIIISIVLVIGVAAAGFGGYWIRTRDGDARLMVLVVGAATALALSLSPLAMQSTDSDSPSAPRSQSRIDPSLMALSGQPGPSSQFATGGPMGVGTNPLSPATTGSGEYVLISASSEQLDKAVAELTSMGLADVTIGESSVSGWFPVSKVNALNSLESRPFIHIQHVALNSGLVKSAGDAAMRTDLARTLFNVQGSGVTVGVISDSYDCLGGAAEDVTNGELPPDVVVLEEYVSCANGTDEGRAMMQLIYDLAPGVDFIFHTGFNGAENMAEGIVDLAEAGADVIVDDVSYFFSPFFQDGTIGGAVNEVADDGVVYFSSAGNFGRQSYEAPYSAGPSFEYAAFPSAPGAPLFFGGTAHEFEEGSWQQDFSVPAGTTLTVYLQWDDSFLSQNGVGAASEIDFYIFDSADTVVAGSTFLSRGGDPVEFVSVTNTSGSQFDGSIGIFHYEGDAPPTVKYLFRGSAVSGDSMLNQAFATHSGTVFGHANSDGAIAVGAVDYFNTPEFDGAPVKESFSSAGGVPILRGADGGSVEEVVREKPDLMAVDGASTTVLDPFFGTSAAAPHAAAIAALMLEDRPGLTPLQVKVAMQSSATDMADSGFDFDTGYGLVDAMQAISRTSHESSTALLEYAANDMAVDPVDSLVYLSVEEGVGDSGAGIVAVDALSGTEVWSFETGFAPSHLALTRDGAFVFVAERDSGTIRRIDISGSAFDMDIDLNVSGPGDSEYVVNELEAVPGNATAIAVSAIAEGDTVASVFLYLDDSRMTGEGVGSRIELSADGAILYSLVSDEDGGEIFKYAVGGSGLSLIESTQAFTRESSDFEFQDGLLFGTSGEIVDGETLTLYEDTGADGGHGVVEPDLVRDRVYFLRAFSGAGQRFPRSEIRGYELSTGELIGSLPLVGDLGDAPGMEMWGSQGFALLTGEGELLIGSFELISPSSFVSGAISAQGASIQTSSLTGAISLSTVDSYGFERIAPGGNEFSFSLLNGQYEVRASVPGFMSCVARGVRVISGDVSLPLIELRAGDVNGDDRIDLADVEAIIGSFGLATENRLDSASGAVVDIDADGYVTGRDASLLASNFGMVGPSDWQ